MYLEYRDRQSRNGSNKEWGWSQRGVDTVKRRLKKTNGQSNKSVSSVYCSSASEFGKVYESHYFKLEFQLVQKSACFGLKYHNSISKQF